MDMSLSALRELVMDREAWCAVIHGVNMSRTRLKDWTELNWNLLRASLVAQTVKNLPAMLDTWVRSMCWEDPLEKEMVTQSSILAWRIPWTEEPGGYSPWCCKELDMTEWLTLSLSNLLNWQVYLLTNLTGSGVFYFPFLFFLHLLPFILSFLS